MGINYEEQHHKLKNWLQEESRVYTDMIDNPKTPDKVRKALMAQFPLLRNIYYKLTMED